jgi:hypothetical protein
MALFMGFELTHKINYIPSKYPNFIKNNEHLKVDNSDNLPFHSNWNWLMEVVEKIESIGAVVTIGRMKTDIQYLHPIKSYINCDISIASGVKINHIYASCVDFVKWYNTQKF